MKRNYGTILIFVFIFITLLLWVLSKPNNYDFLSNPLVTLTQILALISIVLMSMSLLLSTRIYAIENLFGGLDKVYDAHKYIGSMAFLAAINHLIVLVVMALPDVNKALTYLIPGPRIPYDFGISAIYTLIFSFLFIAMIKVKYQTWKLTHRLLGLSFLLAGIHGVLARSDVASNLVLKSWILLIIGIGVISTIYTLLFFKRFGPRYVYKVAKVDRKLDIYNIYFENYGRKMKYKPGQFAYYSFYDSRVGMEVHPFSISSGPDDKFLRISAKTLGDFTLGLSNLNEGNYVYVYGPFGHFGENILNANDNELIWIGGGIGIAPFTNMLKYVIDQKTNNRIHLFYVVKDDIEAVFDEELKELIKGHENIKYTLWVTKRNKYLTADGILENFTKIDKLRINICGPSKMMEDMQEQFVAAGLDIKYVRIENFQLL